MPLVLSSAKNIELILYLCTHIELLKAIIVSYEKDFYSNHVSGLWPAQCLSSDQGWRHLEGDGSGVPERSEALSGR